MTMDQNVTLAECIASALVAGTPIHTAWGECDCGAANVGSDAHYVDCAIGRMTMANGDRNRSPLPPLQCLADCSGKPHTWTDGDGDLRQCNGWGAP